MDPRKRLEDFYEGKLNPQEVQELLDWLDTSEAEDLLSAEIIQLWSQKIKSQKEVKWDNQPLWEKINKEKSGYSQPYLRKEVPQKRLGFPIWLKAGVVLLVLGLSALFWMNLQQGQGNKDISLSTAGKLITRSNAAGQKTRINLPDGSTVFLNSESKLIYPEDFRNNRSIQLEGEGFFKVAKDPKHPFTVEANGILTTALGTSFNINTFTPDQKVAVTLLTGKVRLSQKGKSNFLELNPGEESLLSLEQTELEKYPVSPKDKILWTEGILRFSETPFGDMVPILERWYGVDIQVKGNPVPFKASGTFESNESLSNVLHVLGSSMDFEYQITNKEVIITFN